MIKKVFLMLLFLCFTWHTAAYAVSRDDFVLNIVHDGYPVREMREISFLSGCSCMETPCLHRFISSEIKVSIPFDDEYKIRLKNSHDRKCTATVFIDGAPVSKIGDIILNAGGSLDLERFLDSSLTEGKRFKFVRLEHPDVDDPTRKENGLIRVEFRMERKVKPSQGIIIIPWQHGLPQEYFYQDNDLSGVTRFYGPIFGHNFGYTSVFCSNTSSTAPGATVQGGDSDQAFRYADIDVEDKIHVLELRIVGINEVSLNYPQPLYWPW